jgi:hypothetical protein
MNSNKSDRRFRLAALGALVLAISAGPVHAADGVINLFNNASEVGQWRFDFGGVSHNAVFDSAMDANGNPASGSMRVDLGFNTALGGDNKGAYTRDIFPGLDGSTFSALQMDLRIDSGSAMDAFGNNGFFQLVIRNTGNYDYNVQFQDNVRSADGWRHIVVTPLTGAVNDIRAITWQLYGGPSQNIPGPVTLWIDNVVLVPVPEPAPLAFAALGAFGLLAYWWRRRA